MRIASVTLFVVVVAAMSAIDPVWARAQTLAFARHDYRSDVGARAIASADFNRDGLLDLAQANSSRNSVTVLLGHTGATLVRAVEVPVGAGPFELAAADFNRDGIADLAVVNADGDSVSILLGHGDGSFTRTDIAAPGRNPRGIVAADVNGDGRTDVVYTGFATGTVHVLLGNGSGGFTPGRSLAVGAAQPQGITAADFNHDGRLDLAVACVSTGGLQILQATAGGSFTATRITGHANLNVIAAGDLNADGWTDVAAASTGGGDVAVYLGGPAGLVFTRSLTVGASPRGVALADVTSDGLPDVITANRGSNTVSVLPGNRAQPGTFGARKEFVAATGARAVTTGDFDADGRLDIATANEYAIDVTVLSNVTAFAAAAFSFQSLTLPAGTSLAAEDTSDSRFASSTHLAAADFNRDGKTDFAVPAGSSASPTGVIVLLRGAGPVMLTGPQPLTSFVVDDFNADGSPDVLYYSIDQAAGEITRFLTYLGDGRGHFTGMAVANVSRAIQRCTSADINRDGRSDLVCDNVTMLGNGTGTFRPPVPYADFDSGEVPGPLLADIDRDGILDVITGLGVYRGDGAGGFTLVDPFEGRDFQRDRPAIVADFDRDGRLDLLIAEGEGSGLVVWGSADGFSQFESVGLLEGSRSLAAADLDVDGRLDIVQNGSIDPEGSGQLLIRSGNGARGFDGRLFSLPPGPVIVGDFTGDGLPDVATYDATGVRMLVNERNSTNHPPVVPDYNVTSGSGCVTLDARASDPDQHSLFVNWFDPDGVHLSTRFGDHLSETVCVEAPGTYRYRRTAIDTRGGVVSGTVTVVYQQTLKELVLYAGGGAVATAGNWSRVADSTAAGGFRAHDLNAGAPKVPQPLAAPVHTVTIPFVADTNLAYKLWIRLKADGNNWANDSVWVQFSGTGLQPYTAGTTEGLAVSLEECIGCGVSGWGWEDDGFGAINRSGVLLHFEAGPQTVVIQTREDGVSIDQIVLSAEKYLTKRPGAAKNDHIVLPATPGQP